MKILLVPVDFSPASLSVVEAARDLAQGLNGRVILLHVVRPEMAISAYEPLPATLTLEDEREATDQLLRYSEEIRRFGPAVEIALRYGDPATWIRTEAERSYADYILVGSHGHGAVYDLLVGSTASALIRTAPCPVLVIPDAARRTAAAPAPTGAVGSPLPAKA